MKTLETGRNNPGPEKKITPPSESPQQQDLEYFFLSDKKGCHRIDCNKILYITAGKYSTTIFYEDGHHYKSSAILTYFEKQLCPYQFVKICRNVIVNLAKVIDYDTSNGKRQLTLEKLPKPLEVSRRYNIELRRRLLMRRKVSKA